MKKVSNELNNYLNNERNFTVIDMYALRLNDGQEFYISSGDVDVEYAGRVWKHDLFIIGREQIKLQGAPTVDTLGINIKCSSSDKLNGVPFMLACHNGMLDGAMMALYKAYFRSAGTVVGTDLQLQNEIVGAYKIFEGLTEVSSVGGLGVKLSVKSVVQGLAQNIPVRVFAPQSAYRNDNGTVTTSDKDEHTMLIPLKPSMRVLVKL